MRAFRKQNKTSLPLEETHDEKDQIDAEEEEEEEEVVSRPSNMFAAFLGDDDDDDNAESETCSDKEIIPVPKPVVSKKKNKKKAAHIATTSRQEDDGFSLEDIDKTLQEIKQDTIQPSFTVNEPETETVGKLLLQVDVKSLDYQTEMKRMFGSRAIVEAQERPASTRRRNARKPLLAQPTDRWPRMGKIGLSMEFMGKIQEDAGYGTSHSHALEFVYQHAKPYQEIQKTFLQCIRTHDPSTIAHLLHMYPYHIDSLLQLSEVSRISGDQPMACELIERALYGFEKGFHSMFNVSTGICRVPYNRVENRSFHIALFRHIFYVARKGCWQTAFEFSKLLLSLDPLQDPLGSLLFIDFYALKAKQTGWVKQAWDTWHLQLGLKWLPHWCYSRALAEWMNESEQDHTNSTRYLLGAIASFPHVIPALYAKLGLADNGIKKGPDFQPLLDTSVDQSVLNSLIQGYIDRMHVIWKETEICQWLQNTVKQATLNRALIPSAYKMGMPITFLRHYLISDMTQMVAPSLTAGLSSASMHDPLPPPDSVASVYDEPGNTHPLADSNPLTGFLLSFLPWNQASELPVDNRILMRDVPPHWRHAIEKTAQS